MTEESARQFEIESKREHGRVLTGRFRHWCAEWDFLTVDETTLEYEACTCDIKSGRE